jgi:hypothetical protein
MRKSFVKRIVVLCLVVMSLAPFAVQGAPSRDSSPSPSLIERVTKFVRHIGGMLIPRPNDDVPAPPKPGP